MRWYVRYNFLHTGPTTTEAYKPQPLQSPQLMGFTIRMDAHELFKVCLDEEMLWYLQEDALEVQLWTTASASSDNIAAVRVWVYPLLV